MRYPSLNKLPQQAISVPSLSGGLNLADSLHLVNDNQLTNVKNMWFKNSILQTRPAVKEQSELLNESRVSDGHLITNFFVDLEQTVDGEKVGLLINKDVDLNALSTYYNIQKISNFFNMDKNEIDFINYLNNKKYKEVIMLNFLWPIFIIISIL